MTEGLDQTYDRYHADELSLANSGSAYGAEYLRHGQYPAASMTQGGRTVTGLAPKANLIAGDIAGNEAYLIEDMQGEDSGAAYAYHAYETALKLKSFVASGNMSGAKAYRDEIRRQVDYSRDVLLELSQIKHAGDTGAKVASGALFLLNGDYDRVTVPLSDGTEATVGQIMSDDGYFQKSHRDSLKNKGFSESAVNAYYSDDENVRSIARSVMDPMVKYQTKDHQVPPSHYIQVNDLLDFLTSDGGAEARRAAGLFGEDGARTFVHLVGATHQYCGANRRAAQTLLQLAEAVSAQTGITGYGLVNQLMSGYQNLYNQATGGLRADEKGRAIYGPEDYQRQLQFDAVLSKVADGLIKRGSNGVDILSDPRAGHAIKNFMELNAYYDDLGCDVPSLSVNHGVSFSSAAGDYICDAVTGSITPGNLIEGLDALRTGLNDTVVGGIGSTRDLSDPETQKYLARGGLLKAEKSVAAADLLAHGFKRGVVRMLVPRMLQGERADVAFQRILTGGVKETRRAMANSVYSEIRGSFNHTHGGDVAARCLTNLMLRSYLNGGRVDVSKELARMAYGKDSPVAVDEEALRAVRDWVQANVLGDKERVASWRNLMVSQSMMLGASKFEANQFASQLISDAPALMRNGEDVDARFRKSAGRGMFIDKVFHKDPKGKEKLNGSTGYYTLEPRFMDPGDFARKNNIPIEDIWALEKSRKEQYEILRKQMDDQRTVAVEGAKAQARARARED